MFYPPIAVDLAKTPFPQITFTWKKLLANLRMDGGAKNEKSCCNRPFLRGM